MVRLIMGVKGSGKTKQLIELINAAAKDEAGNVVCIEPKRDMSYNIHYNIRLIDAQEYDLHSYEVFRGFISGLYAGNYDISQVFIDNLCKTVGTDVDAETEKFLNWLDVFGERNNIKFTVTISGDVETATDGMRKCPDLKAQLSWACRVPLGVERQQEDTPKQRSSCWRASSAFSLRYQTTVSFVSR